MKLLLDTTYLLPAIGVSIREIPRNSVIKLIKEGYEILISEITFFEISAKGAKYITSGLLTPARVTRGIRAIARDDRIRKVPIHDTPILLVAFKLRKVLSDFIDCLILSSAINRADILVTEDSDIHELTTTDKFKKIIQEINPKFKVKSLKDLLQSMKNKPSP